jgi:hypothetical protein
MILCLNDSTAYYSELTLALYKKNSVNTAIGTVLVSTRRNFRDPEKKSQDSGNLLTPLPDTTQSHILQPHNRTSTNWTRLTISIEGVSALFVFGHVLSRSQVLRRASYMRARQSVCVSVRAGKLLRNAEGISLKPKKKIK